MSREISVAGTFISCLQFHTKPRLEYLLFEKKKNTLRLCLVNQTFLYCLRSEIVLCDPNSIFYRHGRLQHLWPPSCFCQIQQNFSNVALRLRHVQFVRFTL